MGYFKNLEIEIREMDFDGRPLQEIADRVGCRFLKCLKSWMNWLMIRLNTPNTQQIMTQTFMGEFN